MANKVSAQSKFNTYVNEVAALFIEEMKKGNAPWQKPWKQGQSFMPHSAVTGSEYRGINAMLLMLVQDVCSYQDSRWMTFKQVKDQGGSVRKGEKGVHCIFWKELEPERDKNDSSKDEETESKRRFIPCPFVVFNAEQCEGLNLKPLVSKTEKPQWTPLEAAEKILKASKADIRELPQDRAFYRPSEDVIVLPVRAQFNSAEDFYDTALHELGHWTGHSSRLNRDLSGGFGTQKYAREELRAEISSFMVAASLGISHDVSRHAGYVKDWIKVIEKDPKELFRACADAEKIKDYLFSLDKTLLLSENKTKPKGKTLSAHRKEVETITEKFALLSDEEKKSAAGTIAKSLKVTVTHNPYQLELFGDNRQNKQKELER